MRLIPLVFCMGACGGAAAESPLTVTLGITHDQTEAALKKHQFCLDMRSSEVKATARKQTYPRCDRPAAEQGDAWVTARYEGDKPVELRRPERYGDDNHAGRRWNDLLAPRLKLAPESPEAQQQLKDFGGIEPGTRAMKAFKNADGTVVGVYLLTPSAPDNANILEKISYAR